MAPWVRMGTEKVRSSPYFARMAGARSMPSPPVAPPPDRPMYSSVASGIPRPARRKRRPPRPWWRGSTGCRACRPSRRPRWRAATARPARWRRPPAEPRLAGDLFRPLGRLVRGLQLVTSTAGKAEPGARRLARGPERDRDPADGDRPRRLARAARPFAAATLAARPARGADAARGARRLPYFAIAYPTPDGDVLKPTFMLSALWAWALCFAWGASQLPRRIIPLLLTLALLDLPFLVYTGSSGLF